MLRAVHQLDRNMSTARIDPVEGGSYRAAVDNKSMYFEDYVDAAVWLDKELYGEEDEERILGKEENISQVV